MKETNVVPLKSILIAQSSAILFYSFVAYITWLAVPSNKIVLDVVYIRICEVISQWIFSGILILFFERHRLKGKSSKVFWLTVIPLIYFAALGSSLFHNFLMNIFDLEVPRPLVISAYFRFALYYFVPIVFAIVSYGFVVYYYVARSEQARSQNAQLLLQQAKWQMLRYQINPHFLFNALNTIRSMLSKEQKEARQVITEMADYFRFSLAENPDGLIELEKEISAVRNYLEIQRRRYEKNLDFEIELKDGIEKIAIPIFAIQTLVENALKYGMKTSDMPLQIRINGKLERERIIIEVSNTGTIYRNFDSEQRLPADGTQTGLRNLNSRLEVLYRGAASFSLCEENGKVIALLIIPLNMGYEKMESNNYR